MSGLCIGTIRQKRMMPAGRHGHGRRQRMLPLSPPARLFLDPPIEQREKQAARAVRCRQTRSCVDAESGGKRAPARDGAGQAPPRRARGGHGEAWGGGRGGRGAAWVAGSSAWRR